MLVFVQKLLMATNKKLPSTAAIATVASSLYTGNKTSMSEKEAGTSSFCQGNQLYPRTPTGEKNLYTWGKRVNDVTNPNNSSPTCLIPSYISRGGFSPPVFDVHSSPCLARIEDSCLPRFHQAGYTLTPNRPATKDSGSTTPVRQVLCSCQKSPKVILCKTCGETFTGRVQGKCQVHPKKIFLMDLACCIKCQSENLKELIDA